MGIIVGADIGRSNSKIVTAHEKKTFKTCANYRSRGFRTDNTIEIDGEMYSVGISGKGITNNDKSVDDVFKVCLINALGSLDTDEEEFGVVVGLPISHYDAYGDRIISKFTGTEYEYKHQDYSKNIIIKDINVMAEGTGCIENPDSNKDIIVIDIGGYSVDVVLYEHGFTTDAKTYPLGVKKLYSEIANDISYNYNVEFDDDMVESAFRNGFYVIDEKEIELNDEIDFKKRKLKYLERILGTVAKDFNLRALSKNFVGGGSLLFRDILKSIGLDVNSDSSFANAEAFYRKGVELYGKRKQKR